MVRSVVRNADAFLWIERLRERGSYEYDHALGCGALAAAFGRHLGLPEDLLVDLAGGALLLDIGKLKVPAELLHKPGPLAPAEIRVVREHVAHALELLDAGTGVPSHVREMVASHHEPLDGTGYPAGLAGDRIPLLGSIASVIDSYHAMTSKRPYRDAPAAARGAAGALPQPRPVVCKRDSGAVHPVHERVPGGLAGGTDHRRGGGGDGAERRAPAAAAGDGADHARQGVAGGVPQP